MHIDVYVCVCMYIDVYIYICVYVVGLTLAAAACPAGRCGSASWPRAIYTYMHIYLRVCVCVSRCTYLYLYLCCRTHSSCSGLSGR